MSTLPAAVLWDLDGTLIDTEPYWMECEHELVRSFGGVWTDDDAMSIVGFDLLNAAAVIKRRAGLPIEPQQIVDHLAAAVLARIRRHVPWRPGARELLESLNAAGVPCAMVTMSWQDIANEVLLHLPPRTFQAVITGDMVANGKPHPEPYRRAAAALGVDPVSCVAIEDSPTGARSAEAAGCVVVAVPNHVPIDPAPGRVLRRTLVGLTPELLGEIIETTPLPGAPVTAGDGLGDVEPRRRRGGLALWWQRVLGGGWRALGALALVLVLIGTGVWWFAIRETKPSYAPGAFNVHTWARANQLDRSIADLQSDSNSLHQVSPFWYQVTGAASIVTDPQADQHQIDQFLTVARDRGVPIVASLFDRTAPGEMAALLADPVQRAAHIEAIATFAATNNFEGIDLDYENFAFHDNHSTWATTRPVFTQFVSELSERLARDGRILVVTVPPIYDTGQTDDSGYWVYDYGGIAPHVDALRIMAYDYRNLSGEPGPVAPDPWIDTIVSAATDAADGPQKLVLGIPLWRIKELLTERPVSAVTVDATTGDSSFTYDLVQDDGTTSCTQTRQVHYLGDEQIRARMQLSIDRGLKGIALFAFGYQDDAVFTDIDEINATLATDADAAPAVTEGGVAPTTSVVNPTTAPNTIAPTSVTPSAAAPTTVALAIATAGPTTTTTTVAA